MSALIGREDREASQPQNSGLLGMPGGIAFWTLAIQLPTPLLAMVPQPPGPCCPWQETSAKKQGWEGRPDGAVGKLIGSGAAGLSWSPRPPLTHL